MLFFISGILFIACRGFILSDSFGYYQFYKSIPDGLNTHQSISYFIENSSYGWEPGFVYFAVLCKKISSNYFFFQFINSTINIIIIFIFIRRFNDDNIIFSFLFFFLFGLATEINLMRNSKAIMIFLLSLKHLENKKYITFIIYNIIGSFFHTSALLYIPVCLLVNIKFDKKLVLALWIVGNIKFILNIAVLDSIFDSLANINSELRLLRIMTYYVDTENKALSIGYIERTATFLVIYCFSDRIIKKEARMRIYCNIAFTYFLLQLYLAEVGILSGRMTHMFNFVYWILYPRIYILLKRKENKIFFMCVFFGYAMLRLGASYKDIVQQYNNFLFGTVNYSERKAYYDSFENSPERQK
jgi:hypothetical protein